MMKPPASAATASSLGDPMDHRFALLDATLKRHSYRSDALIEVLHVAQEIFGYLDHDLLLYIARGLKLPPSLVHGVATFYHLFTFKPKATHTCVVCLGTACYVYGADTLLAVAEQTIGIPAGQRTRDGGASLETARCVGTCGLAPLVVFDGKVCGHLTPDAVRSHLEEWEGHESAH
jgi:bidirectional [NiFe] hydrogenase diaphorase subunit